jgi:hypothetical protein
MLSLTAGALVLLSLVDMSSSNLGAALAQSTVVIVLILALGASGMPWGRRRVIIGLLLLGMLGSIAPAAIDHVWPGHLNAVVPRAFSPLAMFAGIIAPILITRRVLEHERVQVATVLGAICSYLLIAITFALLFLAVDQYQHGHFFGEPQPTTTFFYFSLVTIATLGYGDYTATSELGHLLSAMEAVVGQVFLVTFVAMIVGRLVSEDPVVEEIAGEERAPAPPGA